MKELLIGDFHFGVKSNSIEWLDAQCELIKTQLFDIIADNKFDRIVFLGDLTDSRYSVNQQVGIELKECIRKLSIKFKKSNPEGYIVFIAGNHDYYSPLEEFAQYNSYQLLFGPEFLSIYNNIKIVDKDPLFIDDSLFLPWYWTENPEHFDELLYNFKFNDEVKAIYCHADLTVWPGARTAALKGCPVYAGHIHFIIDDPVANLHNLGAILPLTFADTNEQRYFYVLDDFKVTDKIANTTTPQFKRILNEKIFDIDDSIFNNSYVQLCISKSNINKAEYIDQIKNIKTKYISNNIRIHIIEDTDTEESLNINGDVFNTNINEYIKSNIPEHLNDKYESIKEKLNANN